MRIPITAPSHQYFHTAFATSATTNHGGVHHQGASLMQSTMSYTTFPDTPQRPKQSSERPRHHPHSQSCQSIPTQHHPTFHPGGADTPPPRPMSVSIPQRRAFNPVLDVTTQQWSGPPPLDFAKPPHRCIPLPDMIDGPAMLNTMLAYARAFHMQLGPDTSQGMQVDVRHVCAPATNPSLGSITILLPDGQVITIHASPEGQGFVTVGDVLDALDRKYLGNPSRQLSVPAGRTYDDLRESCPCLSRTTALHALRDRYGCAGLARNMGGFDIWDLRIG